MASRRPIAALIVILAGISGTLLFRHRRQRPPAQAPLAAAAQLAEATAHPERPQQSDPLVEALRADLKVYRQLVLLVADEANLKGPAREAALSEGNKLHHDRLELRREIETALGALAAQPAAQRDPVLAAALDWMEQDPEVLELDRLAFRDPLKVMQHELAKDPAPEAAALRSRAGRDLAEVDRVEAMAEAEYRQAPQARPRWKAYVEQLRQLLPQAAPPAAQAAPKLEGMGEISGRELPEKVLVLSFDDGPHPVYTEEIKALLQRFNAPGLFFEVGRNLGALEPDGSARLGPLSKLSEDLVKSGYVIGNHSYTHAQLSKETGKPLDIEIGETDGLLKAIPGAHSQLFRFPYGARTPVQLQALQAYHLRSVLWNIDSLDWADPVPASVEDRVLKGVAEEKRGIILFHDIHDRAGKVLPDLVPRLRSQGYTFAALDSEGQLVMPSQN